MVISARARCGSSRAPSASRAATGPIAAGRGPRCRAGRRPGARHPQARRGRRAGRARLGAGRRARRPSSRSSTRSAVAPCGSATPGTAPGSSSPPTPGWSRCSRAIADSLALTRDLGLDPALFLEAVSGGAMDAPYVQLKGKAMLAGEYDPAFALAGALKDVDLILGRGRRRRHRARPDAGHPRPPRPCRRRRARRSRHGRDLPRALRTCRTGTPPGPARMTAWSSQRSSRTRRLTGDPHRRQASHLYGLIVSGAVLATAPDDFRLVRVAVLLFGTLVIYWAAETYVHWIAARSVVQRHLTGGGASGHRARRLAAGGVLCGSGRLPVRRGAAARRDVGRPRHHARGEPAPPDGRRLADEPQPVGSPASGSSPPWARRA